MRVWCTETQKSAGTKIETALPSNGVFSSALFLNFAYYFAGVFVMGTLPYPIPNHTGITTAITTTILSCRQVLSVVLGPLTRINRFFYEA